MNENDRYRLNLYDSALRYMFENYDPTDTIEVRFYHILLRMILDGQLSEAEAELDRKIYNDSLD